MAYKHIHTYHFTMFTHTHTHTHTRTHTQDIEALRDENKRLTSQRSEMDDEIHTLTENLFEEAYKMVDEAKGGKVCGCEGGC